MAQRSDDSSTVSQWNVSVLCTGMVFLNACTFCNRVQCHYNFFFLFFAANIRITGTTSTKHTETIHTKQRTTAIEMQKNLTLFVSRQKTIDLCSFDYICSVNDLCSITFQFIHTVSTMSPFVDKLFARLNCFFFSFVRSFVRSVFRPRINA